jgi:hypothetical protein
LAQEDGAGGWVVERSLDVGEEGDGVGYYAGFCGDVGRVGEAGETEASVVAGQEMGVGDAGDGAVS